MIDTEMESGYQCNCGHSFSLKYMGVVGFNVKFYGQCPKCKARIFEYRASKQRKDNNPLGA